MTCYRQFIVKFVRAVALLALTVAAFGAGDNIVLDTMSQELQRNFDALKKTDSPPYFMAYEITDLNTRVVGATLGVLDSTQNTHNRYLDVTVRVGDATLDNYHRTQGGLPQFTSAAPVSLDDNPAALRQRMWLETDRVYRAAADQLVRIKTGQQVKAADRDQSADFSKEESYVHTEDLQSQPKWDEPKMEQLARDYSRDFRDYPDLLSSTVSISMQQDNRYFSNTEGTKVEQGRGFARIIISASAKAKDGMDVSDFDSFEAFTVDGLPPAAQVHAAVKKVATHVEDLLKAPVAEPFVGPAILSGRAAGVFFHEIFGHRIEGHRQKDESEGQTFTQKVGEQILPPFLTVTFDPTRKSIAGVDLNGYYEYDDEGVKARPVVSVENGILRNFLMSRSPIQGFDNSNGHGRRQPGREVVSRQSNLIVSSTKAVSDAQLKQMLIDEIKRQNKPYGIYFDNITNGFTTTQRAGLQAFSVVPVIVYKVFPDGHEELIRGADIVGTPLASFAKILATGDTPSVFNGFCGAESGSVPVSAVSPAILISEIEVEKKQQGQDLLPLLPSPLTEATPPAGSAAGGVNR